MNATNVPIAAASQPSNFSEEGISTERFEYILNQPYTVTLPRNKVKVTYSGDNKHGHSLLLHDGQIFCGACKVKLPANHYRVARHIVGEEHRKLFAEGDEQAMESENSNPNNDRMQDASDDGMGKKSATSRSEKAPTETAGDDDGDSENPLPVQDGLLVVNGFDVVKYIRGLEGRISDLEAMLAAANAVPSTENDVMA